ncbi:hypothetical protein GCM10009821_03770 [Aeromicrobium halocynthiae]|uniref:Uncharacterized protein n=1 Tax=Aeromicrobium halocynthiae TaxID=560557 RepID=A0ABN2VRH0_9ACTN
MRPLVTAAVLHLVGTVGVGLSLAASEATLAALAMAGTLSLLVWFAALHSDDVESGLPLASSAALVGLTLTGRSSAGRLLPLLAAHLVGATAGGVALLGAGRLVPDGTLVWDEPAVLPALVAALLVGVVAAWTLLAVDGGAPAAWSSVPVVVAAATLSIVLAAAVSPAIVVGLATAGLVGWSVALATAGGVLVGAAIGVFAAGLAAPVSE